VIADNEQRLLRGVIGGANIGEATREEALRFLARPLRLEDAPIDHLGEKEREGVYRTACRLTTVDGEIAASERAFLKRLRAHLELDEGTANDIEQNFLEPGRP
jgi:tellurite resistance protein